MFSNAAFDVFIGLFFLYLIYSLLASLLQEILSRQLSLRTRNLQKAIKIMLEDRPTTLDDNSLKNTMYRTFSVFSDFWQLFKSLKKGSFVKAFYDHPTIKYLGESVLKRKPAYINSDTFSRTLLQLLRGPEYDGTIPESIMIEQTLFNNQKLVTLMDKTEIEIGKETLVQLQQLFRDARKDVDKFKSLIENWYNETMDRATGWYKRQTQLLLFIIGFGIAYAFNADTIAIYKILSKDRTAREQLVQLATQVPAKYGSTVNDVSDDNLKKSITDSALLLAYRSAAADADNASMILSLGRKNIDSCKVCAQMQNELINEKDTLKRTNLQKKITAYNKAYFCTKNEYQNDETLMWTGWLLTALAISMGAPFWFDLVSKLVQIRSTGPKPASADSNMTGTPANTAPGQPSIEQEQIKIVNPKG
ncbi:hypothetical protein DVR12_22870 [Chitinophaga silvatica]|uniref:Uncharacterized protein n=1 Tax=Chitinophaga silvatica TaxID=2282649 RepID=A0A3E1Y433_9BACT|nr:hypothetical protein [Chitinophaga silvatica]RFS19480.1 hypothetical protein DVR12_22870 [Chitinophaga silvatica]